MSIIDLTTFDISNLPTAENDKYEFKSSLTTTNELKKKLQAAVSAFSNSGGGYFIAGVNSDGDADGGILEKVGRLDLRDWVDQAIHEVEPTPAYDIKLIDDPKDRGCIDQDKKVIVVAIQESHTGPHMGQDRKYYIRAGAHTKSARHFIVNALWAKRHFSKPRLTHIFRRKPTYNKVIQLGIIALTNAPATNITIEITPLIGLAKYDEPAFPLHVSAIDQPNPFFFDFITSEMFWEGSQESFPDNFKLNISYKDLANNFYKHTPSIPIENVWVFGELKEGKKYSIKQRLI